MPRKKHLKTSFEIVLLNKTVDIFLDPKRPKWVTLPIPPAGVRMTGTMSYKWTDGYLVWLNSTLTNHMQIDNYRHELGHVLASETHLHLPDERWCEATANFWAMTIAEIDRGEEIINHLYSEMG